jgi:nicotinamidase-related amidase
MALTTLSRATAVFLLVDHQTGVFERVVKAPPREQVEANVLRLARAAAILDIPAILTTSEEEGENGPLLASLEEILPDAYANRIDRHGIIDSLADPAVAEALAATGRRQLITAGIGTEVCGVAPALHAHATVTKSPSSPMPAARQPRSDTTSRYAGWNRRGSRSPPPPR